jgi:hypothetical protein
MENTLTQYDLWICDKHIFYQNMRAQLTDLPKFKIGVCISLQILHVCLSYLFKGKSI